MKKFLLLVVAGLLVLVGCGNSQSKGATPYRKIASSLGPLRLTEMLMRLTW